MQREVSRVVLCLAFVACVTVVCGHARVAGATVVASPDYIVGQIPLPDTVQGDVAVFGTSIFVGQGSFGAGQQQVVRRDWDGTVTALITGLNSIGGLAVNRSYLFVTDNGGELSGAATGDTLFARSAPLLASGPLPAVGLEVAPAGSIPNAQGVAIGPDGEPYVGDAVGSGNGKVWQHRSFFYPPFVVRRGMLDFTAGLAFASNGDLFVGDVSSSTFQGSILVLHNTTNTESLPLTGLSGVYDLAFDHQGRLLISGGFTPTFSSSTLVAFDLSSNTLTQLAEGFSFSTGLDVDPFSGRVYVVDFGVSQVTTLTPIEKLFGGKAPAARDCWSEFSDVSPRLNKKGQPTTDSVCRDGDPSCDRDGASNGSCQFALGVCLNVPRSSCTSPGVVSFELWQPGSTTPDASLQQLATTVSGALPVTGPLCFGPVPVDVPLVTTPTRVKPGKKKVKVRVRDANQRAAVDRVAFRCLP